MTSFLHKTMHKTILASALAATTLAALTATPAMADNRRRGGHGSDTGAIIASGLIGFAVGAAVASGNQRRQPAPRYYPDAHILNADRQWADGYPRQRGYDHDGYYDAPRQLYYGGEDGGYRGGNPGYRGSNYPGSGNFLDNGLPYGGHHRGW